MWSRWGTFVDAEIVGHAHGARRANPGAVSRVLATMSSPACHVPSRWLLRAIGPLVALAVVLVGGSRAQASCGDWLEGHERDGVHSAVVMGSGAVDSDALPAPLRRPCNGPSCGKPTSLPIVPSDGPTSPPDIERDAILAIVAVDGPLSSGPTLPSEARSLPAAFLSRLDRPPRAA